MSRSARRSLTKLGYRPLKLVRAIEQPRIARYIASMGKPQEIANTVWSLGRLGLECPNLIREVCNDGGRIFRFAGTQEVANVAFGAAKMALEEGLRIRLFHFVAGKADFMRHNAKSQEVRRSKSRRSSYNISFNSSLRSSQLCTTIWAFAVASRVLANESAVRSMWDATINRPHVTLGTKEVIMLAMARSMAYFGEGVNLPLSNGRKTDTVRKQSRDTKVWLAERTGEGREVMRFLRRCATRVSSRDIGRHLERNGKLSDAKKTWGGVKG